jgi:hypothetical protein
MLCVHVGPILPPHRCCKRTRWHIIVHQGYQRMHLNSSECGNPTRSSDCCQPPTLASGGRDRNRRLPSARRDSGGQAEPTQRRAVSIVLGKEGTLKAMAGPCGGEGRLPASSLRWTDHAQLVTSASRPATAVPSVECALLSAATAQLFSRHGFLQQSDISCLCSSPPLQLALAAQTCTSPWRDQNMRCKGLLEQASVLAALQADVSVHCPVPRMHRSADKASRHQCCVFGHHWSTNTLIALGSATRQSADAEWARRTQCEGFETLEPGCFATCCRRIWPPARGPAA